MSTKKPDPPPDDPEQYQRFIDMAREVEADDDATVAVFDGVVRKLGATPKAARLKKGQSPRKM
jgi:hypothetical protein